MNTLETVLQLAHDAAVDHPDSVDDAVAALRAKAGEWRLAELETELLDRALREMIHDARHRCNVRHRNERQEYNGTAKVVAGAAVALAAEASLLSTYFIGGRSLGSITGDEIDQMITNEQEKANGAIFNATLLKKLKRKVKGDKRVDECVDEKQVAAMFKAV